MLPTAGSGLYPSDSSAVDMQKYRQLCVAAGSGPSSAVNLVPSAAAAAGATPAVVAAAGKPPAGIITPNIHQPPPPLTPFPPPAQVIRHFSLTARYFSPRCCTFSLHELGHWVT